MVHNQAENHFGGGKIASISVIRMMAMISIIVCHLCQYYESEWAWWLNVGVQIFFIISGFLYGNKQIDEPIVWIKKQFVKILVPYYIFLVIAVIGYVMIDSNQLDVVPIIGAVFTIGTIKGIGHLWFVGYILFCYLMTPYLAIFRNYLIQKKLSTALLILFVIVACYIIVGVLTNDYFRPGDVCCYIFGYFTSVFLKKYGSIMLKACIYCSALFCVVSNILYCYLRYVKNMENVSVMRHVTDFSHFFLGYVIVLILMRSLSHIKYNRVLLFSDKYSYEIYLVHQLFILSPLTLMCISNYAFISIVVTIIAIVTLGIILNVSSNLFMKYRNI